MISVTDFGLDANMFYFGKVCIHGHKYKDTELGLRYKKKWQCVECKKQTDKDYRIENSDKVKERKKEYYERVKDEDWFKQKQLEYVLTHKEHLIRYHRNYQQVNKDRIREVQKFWKRNNPDKVKINRIKYQANSRLKRNLNLIRYRARKRNANHVPYSKEDVQKLLLKVDNQCVYCGYSFEENHKRVRQLDHFFPLSLGGFDTLNNLVPVCIGCNSGKCNRLPHQWYKSQEFYSQERWDYILSVLGLNEIAYELIVDSIKIKHSLTSGDTTP